MPARATSSGTISFGLVSIPVKLYTASQSRAVRFNMLDPKDKSRVKQQYVNASSGEPVERKELVKGYEYAKGQYVVFEEEELKTLERQSDRSIEIEEFLPIEAVDPLFFGNANLLGPDKGGAKAYRLLREAMLASGRVAIGRFATRGKDQLVLIRPYEDGLVLHGLHYADEVRDFSDVDLGDPVALKDGELDLAQQLIDQLTHDAFEPEKYEDHYRQAVLEAVDRKVAGEEVVIAPADAPAEQIIDLMAALKKSLGDKKRPAKGGLKKVSASRGRKRASGGGKGSS